MYLNGFPLIPYGAYSDPGHHGLIFHGLCTFLIAGIIFWLQRKIFKRMYVYFIKTPHIWDDALIRALSRPLSLFIWIFAVASFAEYTLINTHHTDWAREATRLRSNCLVVLLIWFFWRYTFLVEHHLISLTQVKQKIDTNTIATIGRFVRIGLGAIVLLIVLEAIGVPISGVIAFGGGGALVMGLAAQHVLANWFGGLMVYLDKPFKPNEWITSPDRNIEGKVKEIGWRTTKIIGPDNRPFYVPNSIFSQVIIANSQRITHRTIETTISLRYEDADVVYDIVQSIDTLLHTYPSVDLDERYMVHFVGFENSALNIHFACSIKEPNFNLWRDIQQSIFLSVIDIIREHNAQLAHPTVTTYLPEGYFLEKKSSVDKKNQ